MKGRSHEIISEKAVDWLPEESGAYWKPLKETIRSTSNYPNYFFSGELVSPELKLQHPGWREYIMIPNCQGETCHTIFDVLDVRGTYLAPISHWTHNILAEMRNGNYDYKNS